MPPMIVTYDTKRQQGNLEGVGGGGGGAYNQEDAGFALETVRFFCINFLVMKLQKSPHTPQP